jgi:hypothetical protein
VTPCVITVDKNVSYRKTLKELLAEKTMPEECEPLAGPSMPHCSRRSLLRGTMCLSIVVQRRSKRLIIELRMSSSRRLRAGCLSTIWVTWRFLAISTRFFAISRLPVRITLAPDCPRTWRIRSPGGYGGEDRTSPAPARRLPFDPPLTLGE